MDITFKCYASMKNMINTNFDCIIFDEAHHLKSEKRMELFSLLHTSKRIFLSATMQGVLLQIAEMTGIKITPSTLNSNQAIDKNLISCLLTCPIPPSC